VLDPGERPVDDRIMDEHILYDVTPDPVEGRVLLELRASAAIAEGRWTLSYDEAEELARLLWRGAERLDDANPNVGFGPGLAHACPMCEFMHQPPGVS
jgi:hypothetical protein